MCAYARARVCVCAQLVLGELYISGSLLPSSQGLGEAGMFGDPLFCSPYMMQSLLPTKGADQDLHPE